MRHHLGSLALGIGLACTATPSDSDDPSDGSGATATDDGSAGTRDDDGSSADDGDSTDETGGDDPIDTDLPPLPPLPNVRLRIDGDAATVEFDAVQGAVDYRVYPLPPDEAIDVGDDGHVTIADAIYRCAGQREGLYMLQDVLNPDEGWNDNAAGGATILHSDVEGFVRDDDDATLGHVYPTAGEGRVPVYVLGDPDPAGEGGYECGRAVFTASRPKRYTTDAAERDALVADRWRDDGIAFYVPADPAGTHRVLEGTFGDGDVLRWIDGPEGDARGGGTELVRVLDEPGDDTVPLMRVHVAPYCSRPHDELVAGAAAFAKVRAEGDQPMTAVRWSGLTRDTVLVVEALSSGCPYQGNLSPAHHDAVVEMFGTEVLDYEAYVTLDEMRAASPTGEVFVNGQYDEAPAPVAIARSFVHAAPDLPQMDHFATFAEADDFFAGFAEPTGNEYGLHFESSDYSFSSYNNSRVFFGSMLGELWVAYNDIAADVNGKIRLTPHAMGEVTADAFLHVTTEVDIVSSGRRYPQIIISDQVAPVQDNLAAGTTLIVQPKDMTPSYVQVQVCDHRTWDVNDQCPQLPTRPTDGAFTGPLPGEATATDRSVRFDLYLSTERLYLWLDDAPYACVDLPATSFEDGNVYAPPSGPVTVTWGDVLYHSGVDLPVDGAPVGGASYAFHRAHLQITTRRHFDNLGFSSGVAAPAWDEARMPCVGSM